LEDSSEDSAENELDIKSKNVAQVKINIPSTIFTSEMLNAMPPKMWSYFETDLYKTLCLPSFNGYFNTNDLAKIYGILANKGVFNNKRVVSENFIKRLYELQTDQYDCVLGCESRKGLGVMLGPNKLFGKSNKSFGYIAFGDSVTFCDPESNMSIAILINKLNFDKENNQIMNICKLFRNNLCK